MKCPYCGNEMEPPAITFAWKTGDIKLVMPGCTNLNGWENMNFLSVSRYKGKKYKPLFFVLWESDFEMNKGRGKSAESDWNKGKSFKLGDWQEDGFPAWIKL